MDYSKNLIVALLLAVIGTLAPFAAADSPPEKLLAAGRVDDAIVMLQGKIAHAPSDDESYNLLCRAYLTLSNWDTGIAACQKAVSLEPDNSFYHLWLGRAYGGKADHSSFLSAAGLAKKVRTEFENAVRLNPRNLEARADLADFYIEAPGIVGGGRDKAEAQAEELGALDPAQGTLVKARLAEKSDSQELAEKEYRAAVQISGGRPGTWLNLAQFYRRRGRLAEMQDAIQHAVAAPGSQHVLMPAAEVLIRTKRDLPTAADMLRRYLANETVEDAPAFKAHYLLGTLLQAQGNKKSAAQEYRAALSLARNFTAAQNALNHLNREVAEEEPASLSGTE
ncbi:MAG: tetratricopeptide repeat protein [Terriglobales bacterium]